MRIREVLIRWYKSFNYDYELKANPNSTKVAWQETEDGWLPHVRIGLEDDITAVVGANESGKSHLLDAIYAVLTGEPLSQRDFCRYSTLFSVERGKRLFPEVGAVFALTPEDQEQMEALGIPLRPNGELLILRPEPGRVDALSADDERIELTEPQRDGLQALLPHAFQLKTQVDLPDSVSIAALARGSSKAVSRKKRAGILDFLTEINKPDEIGTRAADLYSLISAKDPRENEQARLGRLLLTKVAKIDESSFIDLRNAIRDEKEGLVNALIQEMNSSIARHLNISRWWSQDEDFQLRVSPREHELVFTIRDKTGTDYSFSERSRGLTYFLSYYVQLRSHDRPDDRPEVLLMDEPDAYLSALGQQDLLRVLEDHAHPEDSDRLDGVVYVTHSPFLINRNAGHRVRVVDKGAGDEGTRLVRDATQNHYEPLRTSLGASVAETAFIGGENLFVEGISDQVLLAGINARLLRDGAPPSACLDLNRVTLVPGGSNMAYMLYLARGRDQYKPACAVLLDSDKAGETARGAIRKGGARGRPSVPDDLIVMIGEWAADNHGLAEAGIAIREPEDLVPLNLAVLAARRYALHLLGVSPEEAEAFAEATLRDQIATGTDSLWDVIHSGFLAVFGTEIGKVGFAKELVGYLREHQEEAAPPPGVELLIANFSSLIERLADTLRLGREREIDSRRDHRVERIIEEFREDHPTGVIRDRASVMLRRVEAAADDSTAGDVIRAGAAALRRDFMLGESPMERVPNFPDFLERLVQLPVLVRLRDQGRLQKDDLSKKASVESPSPTPKASP